MLTRVLEGIQQAPPALVFGASAAVAAAIGFVDFLIGQELSLSLFYLVPVAFVAWFLGRGPGALMIILAGASSLLAEVLSVPGPTHPASPFWNLLMQIGVLWAVLYLVLALKRELHREATLSRTDPLTGLLNARGFYEVAERELARAKRYPSTTTIAYFDLDNFKLVNDRFGHRVGDELLVTVAESMNINLRRSDAPARIGGDEFIILMPHTDEMQAKSAVAKLRERLLRTMRRRQWPVTISVGVLSFDTPPSSVAALVSRVDALMYEIKKANKDAVKFEVQA